MTSSAKRRLLYIVNHKTLIAAEIPILRSLGWEVFVPKVLPEHDPGFRSGAITYEHDAALELHPATLRVLNRHNFIESDWPPTIEDIVNSHFEIIVSIFSFYTEPLFEAAAKFRGLLIARVFGREHPRRYSEFTTESARPGVLPKLAAMGERFVFGQGYANISDIEDPPLPQRAHTIGVPLPEWLFAYRDTWVGSAGRAVFLCPNANIPGYYMELYKCIKHDFGDIPHVIFGRQPKPVPDPAVLTYLSDAELIALFQSAPVFVYPSTEPRHIHYSPLEAIIVGTPVLYRQATLMDLLAGARLPGACADVEEMRQKARRLLSGDKLFAEAIRESQQCILESFASDVVRRQWAEVLPQKSAG